MNGQFDLSKIRGLILDMDGVLWRGETPLGDLPAIFSTLADRHLKIMLATNNATRAPRQYIEKLNRLGVNGLQTDQVINSSQATAFYLAEKFPDGGPVYVVGEEGLFEVLEEKGFRHTDRNVLAVVAGLDRTITYEKLKKATLLIRAGALFVGTNPDPTFPIPEGQAPGSGSILAAIQTASGVDPTIIGKPFGTMYEVALRRMGVSPQEVLVIGDRLETDIAGGQTIGAHTALVLSGVTTAEQAAAWRPAPDLVAQDLTELVNSRL